MAADVNEDFLSNFLYILIIFKKQIHKDDLIKLSFHGQHVKDQHVVVQKRVFRSVTA